jgi:hypothetical protein
MKKNQYKVGILMFFFRDHYKKSMQDAEKRKKENPESLENFPKEDDFHITLALESMCSEICELIHLVGKLQQDFDEYKEKHP